MTGVVETAETLARALARVGATAAARFGESEALPSRPYPGLRPFEKEEWPIFRGRDRLIQDILTILADNHFVSIIGPSGSGKSSLVRAGVLATLERRHGRMGVQWRTAAIRPGAAPLWSMADGILRALRPDLIGQDGDLPESKVARIRALIDISEDGLAAVMREFDLEDTENFLLLVDQFEEIFRYRSEEADRERARLIELLLAVASNKPSGLYVVTTMRSEYLGDCARFTGLAETLNATHYLVPRMAEDELRQAIVQPAEIKKGSIHEDLVHRLIDDIRSQQDQLPILQHTLLWMWTQEEEDRKRRGETEHDGIDLGLDDYVRLETAENALSLHGDKILKALTPEECLVAKVMFRRMIEVEDAHNKLRRPTRCGTVAKLADVDLDVVQRVVNAFRAADASFIDVRSQHITDETFIEITHESLIRQWDTLDDWRRREQQSYEIYYDVCRAQRRMQEGTGGLLAGLDLSRAWSWFVQEKPTALWARRYDRSAEGKFEAAICFLEASKEAEDAARKQAEEEEKRRQEEELERERERRTQAEVQAARSLILRGRAALERVGPTRALLIALEGLTRKEEVRYVPEAEALAYDGLRQLRERRIIAVSMIQSSTQFLPQNGTLLLTAGADGWIHLWNAVDGSEVVKKSVTSGYIRAKWSVDGKWVLAGSTTGEAYLVPVSPGKSGLPKFGRSVKFGDKSHQAGPGSFSPDGKLVLTGNIALQPILWDARTLPPTFLWRGEGSGFALTFSSDGERFATAGNDGIIRVYLTETKQLLKERRYTTPILSLDFHPKDCDILLVTTFGGGAFLWNTGAQKARMVKGGKGLHDLKGPRGFVSQGAFSRDGALVATAAEDGVRVWRIADLDSPPIVLKGHEGTVCSLGFDPEGKTIASASSDARVRIWSVEPALRTESKEAMLPRCARPSTSYTSILAQEGGRELVWDTSTSPPELRVQGRIRPVSLGQPRGFAKPAAAAIAPHSNFVLVAPNEQGRPLLYNLESPEAPVAMFGEVDAKWRSVGFAPDASRPIGVTAAGEQHVWTYFPDRASLIEFARKNLPQEGCEAARLSNDDLCQLGLTPA